MDAFRIRGGRPLAGRITVSGAKNSALKLVAAALLAEGRSVISNVPAIADMSAMARILEDLGATVDIDGDAYSIDVPSDIGCEPSADLARRLRASIVVLGPLLARCSRARVALPGGCDLGSRSIDLHLAGLAKMGADIAYAGDAVELRAPTGLRGAVIELPFASVGATENILMAAATAAGETRISNAAREPEIADLAAFLMAMGAEISGAGTSELVIRGVDALRPAAHAVLPDRIEAGTYAVAAVLTGGDVRLERIIPDHLRLVLDKLRAAGAEIDEEDPGAITVRGHGRLRAIDVVTLPYPGVPTDMQPQFLVLLTQASGTSMVTENVFDGRFSVIPELVRLGADVAVEGHHAIVRGGSPLHGATVRATDLRAGAALVLAGLVADGETVVTDPHHVDRGYSDFVGRLHGLGADVERAAVVGAA
ncbi:MAG TPA: UDP-N-acetylglucosamine 1-carboxyvinyltransferase [Egibacteraceae bacterium]|nr:UDP-N-acetylglucosamine 1-carboxyvinyltransferase [Egibacteraceae bacterium]